MESHEKVNELESQLVDQSLTSQNAALTEPKEEAESTAITEVHATDEA